VSRVYSTPVSRVSSTPVSRVYSTPVSRVSSTPVSRVSSTPVSRVFSCVPGELHVPLEVCGAVVKRELDYWQINENIIKSCCWRSYRSYIENKRILDSFNRSISREHVKVDTRNLTGWKRIQTKGWLILEHPRTSRLAMVSYSFLYRKVRL